MPNYKFAVTQGIVGEMTSADVIQEYLRLACPERNWRVVREDLDRLWLLSGSGFQSWIGPAEEPARASVLVCSFPNVRDVVFESELVFQRGLVGGSNRWVKSQGVS